jgi:large subunit ribosomal protein L1
MNKVVSVNVRGGKNIKKVRSEYDKFKSYSVFEAIEFLKSSAFTKFDQTLDVVFKLGVDPRHSDQMVRGMVGLPSGTGKDIKVAVICKDEVAAKAKEAGADLVGSQELIDRIKAGNLDFDVCITSPDMMGMVGQVARILGPKGLMPNPKLGTVTTDIPTAVKNAKNGQVEYKVEKAGLIHAGIGKLSFSADDLVKNVSAIFSAVLRAKPAGLKGTYMHQVYLSSTMGPALKIDTNSIIN